MKNSNWKILIVLSILAILFLSCERETNSGFETVDCAECYQVKPQWGPINMKLTINDENPAVHITIYFGDIEDNDIDTSFMAEAEEYWIDVRPDNYYSLVAEYKVGDKTVFAVDGDKLKLKYTSSDCEEPCYYFSGGYFDLQLRN